MTLTELLQRDDILVEIWRGRHGLVRHGPGQWVIVDALGQPVFEGPEDAAIERFMQVAKWMPDDPHNVR